MNTNMFCYLIIIMKIYRRRFFSLSSSVFPLTNRVECQYFGIICFSVSRLASLSEGFSAEIKVLSSV